LELMWRRVIQFRKVSWVYNSLPEILALHLSGTKLLCAVFWIRIRLGSGINQVSRSLPGFGIWIRIQEGKNDPQKLQKFRNFMF
jgi:hypothetical protein